tara:strand:- start:650 stop:931 length:282 start_codon:yes stop_codon:yes gene_type:complete
MSLKATVTITYEEHQALCNVLGTLEYLLTLDDEALSQDRQITLKSELSLSKCVLAGIASELYKEYQALPNGNHLKLAYEDRIWSIDDTDLATD